MDNDVFESRRERVVIDNRKKSSSKALLPLIIIVILVVIGVGVFLFMGNKGNTSETTDSTTQENQEAPTTAPEPTEEEVDLKAYKIMVINGTEVAGEAGKLKTTLTDAGYDVTAIGNADKTTYTKTIIQAKEDVKPGFISKLKTELEGAYEVGSDEILDADDDNNVEVKVIIGIPADKQKSASNEADTKESPTPTLKLSATPTP